jgi:hypothetical protein
MSLNARGAYLTRHIPGRGVVDIVPLTFGRARLLVSVSSEALSTLNAW